MRKSYGEIIRFAIVGTANFLIIMAVSWLLMHLFSINFYVANIVAYVLGLLTTSIGTAFGCSAPRKDAWGARR